MTSRVGRDASLKDAVHLVAVLAVIFIVVEVIIGAFLWQAVRGIREIQATQDRSLVASWEIEPLQEEYVFGEGDGMVFTGTLICEADVVGENPLLQFVSEAVPASSPLSPRSVRPLGVPREAVKACVDEPVDFLIGWGDLSDLGSITEPTEYVFLYAVSAEGWIGAQIRTGSFVLHPSSP